jgi:hypothetical protein
MNIGLLHVMSKWFELHEKDIPKNYPKDLVLMGIQRLMSNNTFNFGNLFFLQRNGTAMGTNVAAAFRTRNSAFSRCFFASAITGVYRINFSISNFTATL